VVAFRRRLRGAERLRHQHHLTALEVRMYPRKALSPSAPGGTRAPASPQRESNCEHVNTHTWLSSRASSRSAPLRITRHSITHSHSHAPLVALRSPRVNGRSSACTKDGPVCTMYCALPR
jgi:hypothetical protein